MFANGPKLVTQGLDLLIDAADPGSYPGTGLVWTDLRSGITGSLTGSVTYTSEYYGGLTFSDSSSAVIFPGTTANYGTGSFTVEMAFKPDYIEGKHYLMAKNSGSFPNWAIYLSGSNGSGKLWSEFNIDASVSCSVSSSTTFQTGSVYQVDVRVLPAFSASGIYVNGQTEGGTLGNGGGSLTTTASLFVGNFTQNNTQNFSGSIYTVKTYTVQSFLQPKINLNAVSSRFGLKGTPLVTPTFNLLIVAGGGSGGNGTSGGPVGFGGGAGGLQYFSNYVLLPGKTTVVVGSGGAPTTNLSEGNNGKNSMLGSIISIGGGRGKGYYGTAGNGGSGGGGGNNTTTGLGIIGQGNNGSSAGGGGGAGTAGSSRNGGSGSYIPSFAAIGGFPSGWFAGGGGGANYGLLGAGGIGGGGRGVYTASAATPVDNSGISGSGGGGGGTTANTSGTVFGSTGGSGIVAIRYSGAPIAIGGEITQSEGYTYHVYRTVGTSSFTIF